MELVEQLAKDGRVAAAGRVGEAPGRQGPVSRRVLLNDAPIRRTNEGDTAFVAGAGRFNPPRQHVARLGRRQDHEERRDERRETEAGRALDNRPRRVGTHLGGRVGGDISIQRREHRSCHPVFELAGQLSAHDRDALVQLLQPLVGPAIQKVIGLTGDQDEIAPAEETIDLGVGGSQIRKAARPRQGLGGQGALPYA